MKKTILAFVVLALSACSTMTPQQTSMLLGSAAIIAPEIQGVATLGALGDPALRAAPNVTQMTIVLNKTASALRAKRINSNQAQSVLDVLNLAEATTRKAVQSESAGQSSQATQLLIVASAQIGNAMTILNDAEKAGVK